MGVCLRSPSSSYVSTPTIPMQLHTFTVFARHLPPSAPASSAFVDTRFQLGHTNNAVPDSCQSSSSALACMGYTILAAPSERPEKPCRFPPSCSKILRPCSSTRPTSNKTRINSTSTHLHNHKA
ncbi:hypothetical protein M758_4G175900 [Ceratodon purpureus]|nr:hypothetical protein M758_4G175900 [Ceratodon purpureus]